MTVIQDKLIVERQETTRRSEDEFEAFVMLLNAFRSFLISLSLSLFISSVISFLRERENFL